MLPSEAIALYDDAPSGEKIIRKPKELRPNRVKRDRRKLK